MKRFTDESNVEGWATVSHYVTVTCSDESPGQVLGQVLDFLTINSLITTIKNSRPLDLERGD